MDFIHILQKTYTGTPEEIEEVSVFLKEQLGNPEYISYLLHIIANPELEDNLRLAAAIQLKIQVQNGFDIALDFQSICMLIAGTPIRVQLQVQIILSTFIQKLIESEQLDQVLQVCAQFIQTDENHALVSVLIIRCLIKLARNYEFNREVIPVIGQFFTPITQLILTNLSHEGLINAALFIHTALHAASKYATKFNSFAPLPEIENFAQIITFIIEQPAFTNPPFLDKDAIKLAYVLFDSLPPPLSASLLMSIAAHTIKGSDFRTTSESFLFICSALTSDDIWSLINDEQNQINLVAGLFFRTFILTPQEVLDGTTDLHNFLSSTEVSACDCRTPRNGAVPAFVNALLRPGRASLAHYASEIIILQLESFRESGDIGRAYGALQFAGFSLKNAPKEFAIPTAQNIYQLALSMESINNNLFTAGIFQFIGLFPEAFTDVAILYRCFESIIANAPPATMNFYDENPQSDLVQYFAAFAAANLLTNFRVVSKEQPTICNEIRQEVISNNSIQPLLSNVLRICKMYPTDQSAVTIRYFSDFFIDSIAPVVVDYINELFLIFLQYANDPQSARIISITTYQVKIKEICKVIRQQRPDVAATFFPEALLKIEEVSLECNPEILEDVLKLMKYFTKNITQISEPFIHVPRILYEVLQKDYLDEMDENIPYYFVNVIKALITVSPEVVASTPQMLEPIVEIAKHFLLMLNTDNLKFEIYENVVRLFQFLFITLRPFPSIAEVFSVFIQMIKDIDPTYIADIVAAMVHYNPIMTLTNERNAERWINSHSAAFLMGALSVINVWDQLPKPITDCKKNIVDKITEHLANLQKQEMFVESPDIFNVQEILSTFSTITF